MARRHGVAFALLLAVASPGVAAPEVTSALEFSIRSAGTASGFLTMATTPELEVLIDFEYTDRGRGPRLHERYRLGAGGVPVRGEVSGRSYFGGDVQESFSLENGWAVWERPGEEGSRSFEGHPFYFPANSSPGTLALLVRAALDGDGDCRVAALPSGEIRCEVVGERELEGPEGTMSVRLYAVQGLSVSPIYLWLDGDRQLFAFAMDPTTLVIRKGWMEQASMVQEIQRDSEDAYLERVAKRLRHPLPRLVVIRDVDVFDSMTGEVRQGVNVFLYRGKISAVFPELTEEPPEEALILDGRGKMLLPGLWDLHHHAFPWGGLLYLAGGVTAVRDLGSSLEGLLDLEERYEGGREIGPRVFRYGLIDKKSPYSIPTGILVETLDEALAAVRRYARYGYDGIKIYSSVDPQWVAPIAAESHRLGLQVGGHIPAFMTAAEGIEAGFDEINHANFLLLDLLLGEGDDTRTPLRYRLLAEKASQIDLDSRRMQDLLRLVKERGITVDPTLAIFEHLFLSREGEISPVYRDVADHLPVFLRRSLRGEQLQGSAELDSQLRQAMGSLRQLVKRLYDQGTPLVAGTDGPAAFALHRELENLVVAGIPAPEVLRIATLGAARRLGVDHELGSITPGKAAELILVDGNPVENIGDLRRVELILRGEVLYRADELYRTVGIEPFTETATPPEAP